MIAKRIALAMLLVALATAINANAQESKTQPVFFNVPFVLFLLTNNSKDFSSFLLRMLDADLEAKPAFAKDGEVPGTLVVLPNARLAGCPTKGGAFSSERQGTQSPMIASIHDRRAVSHRRPSYAALLR